jgi:signal transduction histidine kinase
VPEKLEIRRSLLGKMLFVVLGPSLVLFSLIGFTFYFQARASLEDEMGRRLVGLARSAAAQLDAARVFAFLPGDEQSVSYGRIGEQLQPLAEANDVRRIYVVDFQQQLIFSTEKSGVIGDKLYHLAGHRREIRRVRQRRAVASTLFQGADGMMYMAGYAPLMLDGEAVAMVGVDADVRFFDQLRAIRRNLFLAAAVGMMIFAVIGVLFARRLTNPIRRLARSAARIAEGDFETEIREGTGDEIQLLGDTLNDMRKSIVARDRELQMMQRGIAHEVRNPLGGMELYCGILSDELVDRPDLLEHVAKIEREIGSLGDVVNEFLDFSKQHVPDTRSVNVHDFFAELLMAYAAQCDQREIEIVKEFDPEPKTAVFDPDLLRRALHNLFLNAIQAMPEKGRLVIGVRRQVGELEITIADTGKGIAPENLENIFTPFYTTKEKGTGLGLPFARKIVESHGGSLTLRSKPLHGTGVVIRLPQP